MGPAQRAVNIFVGKDGTDQCQFKKVSTDIIRSFFEYAMSFFDGPIDQLANSTPTTEQLIGLMSPAKIG